MRFAQACSAGSGNLNRGGGAQNGWSRIALCVGGFGLSANYTRSRMQVEAGGERRAGRGARASARSQFGTAPSDALRAQLAHASRIWSAAAVDGVDLLPPPRAVGIERKIDDAGNPLPSRDELARPRLSCRTEILDLHQPVW